MIALNQHQVYLARYCFYTRRRLVWFPLVQRASCGANHGRHWLLGSWIYLSVVALMTSQWVVLPIIAIIPLSEILSVVIQIGYFRFTKGKRFFKMAPIHLHFRATRLERNTSRTRFWLIGLLAAMVGVGLALV